MLMRGIEELTMVCILLIEDDPLISGPIERALREAHYQVVTAADGRTGLAAAAELHPDLVLLDVMLPEIDGWDVCKTLRSSSTVPILMLTALSSEVDRVLGLELGADDYLTKPFSTRELLARIRAMLRRIEMDRGALQGDRLTCGNIELNLDARRAFKGEHELTLRYKEFELLSLLMSREGEVVTRAELFDLIWGTEWLGDTRTLDVHIRWLREKIEEDPSSPRFIQTVRSVGYRFAAPKE